MTSAKAVQPSYQLSYEATAQRAGHFEVDPSVPLFGIQRLLNDAHEGGSYD